MMKYALTFLILSLFQIAFAQTDLPDFLRGTWVTEDKEIYEHWDKLNDHCMKGFSYRISNGKMTVNEYLDITRTENGIIYTAYVLKQNQGEGIKFNLTQGDSVFVFENPDHDFPKQIVYRKLSDSEIMVRVSDGGQKVFVYRMKAPNMKL
jgi:hypothetical protein